MTSDYKKYSLERLEEWMHDAMSVSEASPQEIYDVIVGVVKENYYVYKQQASQAYELLALLNGNGKGIIKEHYDGWDSNTTSNLVCDKDDPSPECQKSWNDFWGAEDEYYPHPDQPVYTEEELNAMCEKAASDQEKEKCREYNLREAEYYDKRAQLDIEHSKHYYDYTRNDPNRKNPFDWLVPKEKVKTYDEMITAGWTMTADGFWIKENKKKWVLPVEEVKDTDTDKTDYFVSFPDDLLEAANLKEGDQVQWIDNGDGSYTITKVTKPLGMDEC